MFDIILLIVFAVVSYLFGNLNWAIFISKLKKVDIRSMGSGNPGTLNMSTLMQEISKSPLTTSSRQMTVFFLLCVKKLKKTITRTAETLSSSSLPSSKNFFTSLKKTSVTLSA